MHEHPKSRLHISFPWVRYDAWVGVAEKAVILKLIWQSVKIALDEGWDPSSNGNHKIFTPRFLSKNFWVKFFVINADT